MTDPFTIFAAGMFCGIIATPLAYWAGRGFADWLEWFEKRKGRR